MPPRPSNRSSTYRPANSRVVLSAPITRTTKYPTSPPASQRSRPAASPNTYLPVISRPEHAAPPRTCRKYSAICSDWLRARNGSSTSGAHRTSPPSERHPLPLVGALRSSRSPHFLPLRIRWPLVVESPHCVRGTSCRPSASGPEALPRSGGGRILGVTGCTRGKGGDGMTDAAVVSLWSCGFTLFGSKEVTVAEATAEAPQVVVRVRGFTLFGNVKVWSA
jgi:hypothetical protein